MIKLDPHTEEWFPSLPISRIFRKDPFPTLEVSMRWPTHTSEPALAAGPTQFGHMMLLGAVLGSASTGRAGVMLAQCFPDNLKVEALGWGSSGVAEGGTELKLHHRALLDMFGAWCLLLHLTVHNLSLLLSRDKALRSGCGPFSSQSLCHQSACPSEARAS